MESFERWTFTAEYYQKESALAKKLILHYYPSDNAVELFDVLTRKIFLRRCHIDVNLSEKDMFVGSKVEIYGRCITITDYGDLQTKQILQVKQQRAFILIKPDGMEYLGKIWCRLSEKSLQIKQLRTIHLQQQIAEQYYQAKFSDTNYSALVAHVTSGPIAACEIIGNNAVEVVRQLIGDNDPVIAAINQPNSFRALHGKDVIENLVDAPSEPGRIEECLSIFFGAKFETTARFFESTICLILPHAIKEGKAGKIICDIVQQGFKITTQKLVQTDRRNSEEFYEVYKGVVPEYVAMTYQLSSGPCLAMEIVAGDNKKCDTLHTTFRAFCGPSDPEIARQIRPHSLRAKYGNSKVQNAVHCTNLEEDVLLELEYYFQIMD